MSEQKKTAAELVARIKENSANIHIDALELQKSDEYGVPTRETQTPFGTVRNFGCVPRPLDGKPEARYAYWSDARQRPNPTGETAAACSLADMAFAVAEERILAFVQPETDAVQSLRNQLANADAQLRAYAKSRAVLLEAKQELEANARMSTNKLQALREQLDDEQARYRSLAERAEAEMVRAKEAELALSYQKKQYATAQARLAEIETATGTLKVLRERDYLQKTLDSSEEVNRDLARRLSQIAIERDDWKHSADTLARLRDEVVHERDTWHKRVLALTERTVALEADRDAQKRGCDKLTAEVGMLNSQLTVTRADRDAWKSAHEALCIKLDETRAMLDAANTARDAAHSAAEGWRKQVDRLQSGISLAAENNRLRAEVTRLETAVAQLSAEIEAERDHVAHSAFAEMRDQRDTERKEHSAETQYLLKRWGTAAAAERDAMQTENTRLRRDNAAQPTEKGQPWTP